MWAKVVSYIIHPAIVPVLGVLVVTFGLPYHIPEPLFYFVLLYVFAGTYLFPLIITFGLYKLKFISSIHMATRRDRIYPFAISAMFYFLTAKAVLQFHFPADLAKFIFAGCGILVIQFVMLSFTKVSAHAAGASALLTWLFYLSSSYNTNLLLPIAFSTLGLGLICSARLSLKAHSIVEIVLGISLGMVAVMVIYI